MRRPAQPSLLDWTPPETTRAFEPQQVRGATLEGQIARAVSVAMQDSGLSRAEIAKRMSAYLGETVSKAMLDAYASVAREGHSISFARMIALVHATGDRRLLELAAAPFDWTVIERRHLKLIKHSMLQEKAKEMLREAEELQRAARREGLL